MREFPSRSVNVQWHTEGSFKFGELTAPEATSVEYHKTFRWTFIDAEKDPFRAFTLTTLIITMLKIFNSHLEDYHMHGPVRLM